MAHYCKQKRVKVPMVQNSMWVQSLKKGDRVRMPPGCTVVDEPERLQDDLFQKYEFMSVDFKKLPYSFIEPGHPKEDDVQSILRFSLKQQKDENVAYSSGFVCTVVAKCLTAIDVPCRLVMGHRKIEKDSPFMWLNLDGVTIDNAYEKFLTKAQITFLEKETPTCYRPCDSFSYEEKSEDFQSICIKKGLEIFMKDPDKGIALGLNQEPLYLYYFAMVRFMYDSYGIHIKCIDPSVRYYCWGCGVFPAHSRELLSDILPLGYVEVGEDSRDKIQGKFKHCNQCMVSNYCSVACQKKDWERQHRYLCVSRVAGPASDY